jgi:hypothetical protein
LGLSSNQVDGQTSLRAVASPQAVASTAGVRVASVDATPSEIEQMDVLTIGTRLHNAGAQVDNVTVQLDIYNESGQAVLHERQSGLALYSGGGQSVYWEWRIPQRVGAGDYAVGVTVYDTASKALLAREDRAATFTVTPR